VAVVTDERAALRTAGVILDFSTPAGTARLVGALEDGPPRPLVVAVTGLDGPLVEALSLLGKGAPVLLAPNLSLGAAVLRLLAARAARALADFDVEVVETHHRHKADAPSGTAADLVRAVALARGLDPAGAAVHGRGPGDGPRRAGSIGVHAVRGGSVAGEHEVRLLGEKERLVLHHTAEGREIFARGAIRACRWIEARGPGLYSMQDVVAGTLGP
jgi:4-hydroxy-tetrahydrodipicolinate reductase